MNAIEPLATCRWCRQPIGLFPAGTATTWVHTGERGAFPCRDRLTGMCLTTYATPTTPPGGAVGRSHVEPQPDAPAPREELPPDNRPRGTDTPPTNPHESQAPSAERPHHRVRPRGNRPPAEGPWFPRHAARRPTRRRPLSTFLPAPLRRRRPSRAHSLRRLHTALGYRQSGWVGG